MKYKLILLAAAVFVAAGTHTDAAPKPTIERGWIGGEYETAQRGLAPAGRRSAIYVKQVYAGTPAAQAGLRPGDLVLMMNGHPISDLRSFHRFVGTATPGTRATMSVLREGQSFEVPLTIGRETYHQWHAFSLGFHASSQFDLWPNPDFSLLPLARYKRPQKRVELRAPEVVLARQADRERSQGEVGVRSEEGWDAWFLLFGLNAHKRILSQEMASPTTAMR